MWLSILHGTIYHKNEYPLSNFPMKIKEIIQEEPLEKVDQSFGMTTYYNSHLQLVGGTRSGSSPEGSYRLRYIIYDSNIYEKTHDAKTAEVGLVDLFVDDVTGDIIGLVNIEIKPKLRKSGYGSMVVRDIKDTVKTGFTIHDIQKKAQGFWDKVGTQYDSKLKRTGRIMK
jgi:hypothetical protein